MPYSATVVRSAAPELQLESYKPNQFHWVSCSEGGRDESGASTDACYQIVFMHWWLDFRKANLCKECFLVYYSPTGCFLSDASRIFCRTNSANLVLVLRVMTILEDHSRLGFAPRFSLAAVKAAVRLPPFLYCTRPTCVSRSSCLAYPKGATRTIARKVEATRASISPTSSMVCPASAACTLARCRRSIVKGL